LEYLAFLDCLLRSPVLQAVDMLVLPPVLQHAFDAVLHSELVSDTTAAAALASALASLAKRTVQFVKAAAALPLPEAAATTWEEHAAVAAACFPAAVSELVGENVTALATSVSKALDGPNHSPGAGGLGSQAAASAALLAVVLARSLVQLADAMDALGPLPVYKRLLCKPRYTLMLTASETGAPQIVVKQVTPSEQLCTPARVWQNWQLAMLGTMQPLVAVLGKLGMAPALSAAAATAAAEGTAEPRQGAGRTTSRLLAGEQATTGESNSEASSFTAEEGCLPCSSSRPSAASSSTQQVKWGYLLQLQQCSPRWAAAVAAFNAKWPTFEQMPAPGATPEQIAQLYLDAVGLCRSLAEAAPITVVCNNPDCESLAGVREAAAACKACPGCKCRYCSAGCYKADWKRHKHACKQLAAAGYACAS
jgi:hypothetical protein